MGHILIRFGIHFGLKLKSAGLGLLAGYCNQASRGLVIPTPVCRALTVCTQLSVILFSVVVAAHTVVTFAAVVVPS